MPITHTTLYDTILKPAYAEDAHLKHKLVGAHGDGAYEYRIEHLVVVLGFRGAHVDDLPLQIILQLRVALECDLKLERLHDKRAHVCQSVNYLGDGLPHIVYRARHTQRY